MFHNVAVQHGLPTYVQGFNSFPHTEQDFTVPPGFSNMDAGRYLPPLVAHSPRHGAGVSVSFYHSLPTTPQPQEFQYPSRLLGRSQMSTTHFPAYAHDPYLGHDHTNALHPSSTFPRQEVLQSSGGDNSTLPNNAIHTATTSTEAPRPIGSSSNTVDPKQTYLQTSTRGTTHDGSFASYTNEHDSFAELDEALVSEELYHKPAFNRRASSTLGSSACTTRRIATPVPPSSQLINSFEAAKEWRNRVREAVPNAKVPQEVQRNPQGHVDELVDAMRNMNRAQDGRRTLRDGTVKRESTAFRQFVNSEFDQKDVVSACWVLLEIIMKLHEEGCRLRPSQLPAPVRDGRSELELSFEERFKAIKDLLETEKMAAKDVIDGGELECMRVARCPLGIKRDKVAYRKTNDRRPTQLKRKMESTPSKSGTEEEEVVVDKGRAKKKTKTA